MDVSVLVATKAGSIMGPIASVFGYIMDFLFRITSSMGIMNIGLCIILFTIITKLLLFPLTIKQQESSKLMSLMNPEIKAVQNRYKGKTDQASMAKQQVEMQAVYEKYGSNPMAGCLPMAIQLPIIFALYRVIYNIPAYVPSVRVFFDNVANPLMGQPDYINKISELASGVGMAVDKVDYTVANKVVDMLYFPLFHFYWPDWVPGIGGELFEFFRPVFNIADSAISVGVILVLLFYRRYLSTDEEKEKK